MRTNESTVDRVVRLVVAAVAVGVSAAIGFGTVGGIILLVVAGIMAVTAAVGFCPLYALFGISTCPVRQG
jgi:hypothetical protein